MDVTEELKNAINERDVKSVKALMAENKIELRTPENIDLLWFAFYVNSIEIMQMLIHAGADVNAKDPIHDDGFSFVHAVIAQIRVDNPNSMNKEYERLAILAVEYGANVNAYTNKNKSVLKFAIDAGTVLLTKELLNRGAQANGVDENRITSDAANSEKADELLPLLVMLNVTDEEVRSQRAINAVVAQLSSSNYNLELIKSLIEVILDVNQLSENGDTLLVAAALHGKIDVVKIVLARGADINRKTAKGVLPIYAASMADHSLTTQILIKAGASIDDRNDDGKYPIHGACLSRSVENLYFLLCREASTNVTDNNGQYPMHVACSNVSHRIALILISLGTPVNVTDKEGNTPLSININYPLWASVCTPIIKQLALLVALNKTINERDLKIIEANPETSKLYRRCCNELEIMNQTTIVDKHFDLNLLSLLSKSTKTLARYLNNPQFIRTVENELCARQLQLPIYLHQLQMAFVLAKMEYKLTRDTENLLQRYLPVTLPYLAVEKIAHYLCSEKLIRNEIDFYFKVYEKDERVLLKSFSNSGIKP